MEDLHAKIKALTEVPLDYDAFALFANMEGQIGEITEWPDFYVGVRPAYYLRRLTSEEILQLGTRVFREIHTTVTVKTVAGLLLLAYNLRDTAGTFLFGDVPDELADVESLVDYDAVDTKVLFAGPRDGQMKLLFTPTTAAEIANVGTAYSYLAASYLRLFTKSASNYTMIGQHLRERFSNFYNFQFPFDNHHPTQKVVAAIKLQLDYNPMMKHTLYNLLYAGEIDPNGDKLKNFLYRFHLEYTGLHSFALFVRCMAAFNVSAENLAAALYSSYTDATLRRIATVFANLESNRTTEYSCRMWRFARIFSCKFHCKLQTKMCVQFVAILAYLLEKDSPSRSQHSALRIAQIANITESQRKIAISHSDRAYTILNETRTLSLPEICREKFAGQDI